MRILLYPLTILGLMLLVVGFVGWRLINDVVDAFLECGDE